MNTGTDRITIVEHRYSYDLVTDDGTVLAAGIATRQDAEDRRREFERTTMSVEWGVGDPDDCDDPDSVCVVSGPSDLTRIDRTYGRVLLRREVRRGPWERSE